MNAGKPRENNLISELVLFGFDSLCIHSTVLKILGGKAETKQQISRYLLNNANQLFSIVCESSEYSN